MISPNPGEFRHLVTLKRPSTTKGTRGQNTGAATTLGTARAQIETLSGREAEIANQKYAGASLRVTMYYFDGLQEQDYVEHGARILQIGHVDNVDQADRYHVLLCSEDK